MRNYEKDFPNLSKLGIALLEHWVNPILGSEVIQVIKSPLVEKELVASIANALHHAEERFIKEYQDEELTQIILNMPFSDLPAFLVEVRSFVDRPIAPQLQEYLVKIIFNEIRIPISEERAKATTGHYIRLVCEELSMVSDSFRNKIVSNSVLQTEENTAAVVNRLEKILQILSKNPLAELPESHKILEDEELKLVLKTLYEKKQNQNQLVTRADLFCSLVRRRIDNIDLSKRSRVNVMLDDFDQRLNAAISQGKFEVTDAVRDLLAKACHRAEEVGKNTLGVILLMEVLLEDPGENITKGLSKHEFTPDEILYEMRYHSLPDLFQ
jgi:hypothetical protein